MAVVIGSFEPFAALGDGSGAVTVLRLGDGGTTAGGGIVVVDAADDYATPLVEQACRADDDERHPRISAGGSWSVAAMVTAAAALHLAAFYYWPLATCPRPRRERASYTVRRCEWTRPSASDGRPTHAQSGDVPADCRKTRRREHLEFPPQTRTPN